MAIRFYMVEDDLGVRRILKDIIHTRNLGIVAGETDDGEFALGEIERLQPEIVLLDILLEGMDGLEIADHLHRILPETKIIMISEVASKDIIGRAYASGVEYYVYKPVNVIEIVSVIDRVIHSINLKNALRTMGSAGNGRHSADRSNQETISDLTAPQSVSKAKTVLQSAFKDLGIYGDAGIEDLIRLCEMVSATKDTAVGSGKYNVNTLYERIVENYHTKGVIITSKGIEQRIRRIVLSALCNIANLGIEDYGSYKFERYSTLLFNFKEVKQEMDYIRGRSPFHGKICVKRFVDGLISLIE